MANQPNEGFTDNWAYLKTELGWLDRMLMMALSRYRQDKKEIDRVAKSKADKVSSHWWKGVISLDGKIAYDEHRPNAKISTVKTGNRSKSASTATKSTKASTSKTKPGYQQQLETRLTISRKNGVVLGLPWFRDRLNLSLFEKNLIIMALAPEVNRRYARLYRYLQSQDENPVTDLPTVELVLRLLCRNDVEWRRARTAFHPEAPLMRHGLLVSLNDSHDPFLNATLRLNDDFVDCLLAETPDPSLMEKLLAPTLSPLTHLQNWPLSSQLPVEFSKDLSIGTPATLDSEGNVEVSSPLLLSGQVSSGQISSGQISSGQISSGQRKVNLGEQIFPNTSVQTSLHSQNIPEQSQTISSKESSTGGVKQANWDDLVIAPELKASLQHLSHRLTLHKTVQRRWNDCQTFRKTIYPGLVTVFAGPSGTEKSLTAEILAHDIGSTVHCVNLASVMDIDYFQLLDELERSSSPILLIRSAERWLSRTAEMPYSRLNHFLAHRHQHVGLTIFNVDHTESVSQVWQEHIDQSFLFTLPSQDQRLILWRRAFPPKIKVSVTIDWETLSQIHLSGEEIEAIAHDALIRMMANGASTIKMEHLVAALQWQHVPDNTIQTFVDTCKLARKQALEAKAKHRAATAKQADRKSTNTKSKSIKSTPKKSTSKQTRRAKADKSDVDGGAPLSDPLMSDEATPSPNADDSNSEFPITAVQATELNNSTIQTPSS